MSDGPDPAYRVAVSYIDKSREYYRAQGYDNPYRWAHYIDVPFTPLAKPLAKSRVALVTTASLIPGGRAQDPLPDEMPVPSAYVEPSDPPPARLYTQHRFWDKDATHTDDLDSFFPIHRLRECAAEGRIGEVSSRFYGVPTEYSQRRTVTLDAPQVLEWCRGDGVDVAMLVPL